MNAGQRVWDKIAQSLEKTKKPPSMQEMNRCAEVIVRCDGAMDPESAAFLYKLGALKYSGAVKQWSRNWDMSQSEFEPQGLVNVLDLAGVAPIEAPEPAEGSSSSKPKKKKSKAK